jgi:hypothetical protein
MSKNDDSFLERIQHGWNAFRNKDPIVYYPEAGASYSRRPDRVKLTIGNERSIISSIYTRIAIDVASMPIRHVEVDDDGNYKKDIKSTLNDCLSISANMDQTGRALIQDMVMSMFDEGCVAVVPVDTTFDPSNTEAYEILSLRTAKITEWFPSYVRVNLYNDKTGRKEDLILPKKDVAIIENPLYAVMNEPNSTLSRLIYKLNLLDAIDTQSGSGKLDLIIQLPYVIKSAARKEQAEARRKDIEFQMTDSKYGVAYTDATEKITQLNRPAENNLMKQIEYLTSMLHSQLGMTESIFDGTADEKTMLNYINRTIEPILSSGVDEFKRKFLTKTARSRNQSIMFFRDPFRLVPVSEIAEIADKLTRNEVLTSNEIRAKIGFKPSDDPKANVLQNKNISAIPEDPVDLEKKKEVKVNVKEV